MRFINDPDIYNRLINTLRSRMFSNQYHSAPEFSPEAPKSRPVAYSGSEYHTEVYKGDLSMSGEIYKQPYHHDEQSFPATRSGTPPREHRSELYEHRLSDAELINMAIEAVKNGQITISDLVSALRSGANDSAAQTPENPHIEVSQDLHGEAMDEPIGIADDLYESFHELFTAALEQAHDEAGYAPDDMHTEQSLEEIVKQILGGDFAELSLENILGGMAYPLDNQIDDYTISILLLCIKCYDIWHYEKSYAQHQRIA